MASVPLCDQCRASIDPAHPEALIIGVHRGVDADEWMDDDYVSGTTTTLRFCSEAHLRDFVARNPLPMPMPRAATPTTFGDHVGSAVIISLLVALVAGAFYGFFQLVHAIVG